MCQGVVTLFFNYCTSNSSLSSVPHELHDNSTFVILLNTMLSVYTVFLLKIRHLLFFGTLSLKCVLNLQISASALVLRHSKPTARREKSLLHGKELQVQNTCSSPHLQLFGAYGDSATITFKYWASKSEVIYFAPNFRRNTVAANTRC